MEKEILIKAEKRKDRRGKKRSCIGRLFVWIRRNGKRFHPGRFSGGRICVSGEGESEDAEKRIEKFREEVQDLDGVGEEVGMDIPDFAQI